MGPHNPQEDVLVVRHQEPQADKHLVQLRAQPSRRRSTSAATPSTPSRRRPGLLFLPLRQRRKKDETKAEQEKSTNGTGPSPVLSLVDVDRWMAAATSLGGGCFSLAFCRPFSARRPCAAFLFVARGGTGRPRPVSGLSSARKTTSQEGRPHIASSRAPVGAARPRDRNIHTCFAHRKGARGISPSYCLPTRNESASCSDWIDRVVPTASECTSE
jgi:hypothetical protein